MTVVAMLRGPAVLVLLLCVSAYATQTQVREAFDFTVRYQFATTHLRCKQTGMQAANKVVQFSLALPRSSATTRTASLLEPEQSTASVTVVFPASG